MNLDAYLDIKNSLVCKTGLKIQKKKKKRSTYKDCKAESQALGLLIWELQMDQVLRAMERGV